MSWRDRLALWCLRVLVPDGLLGDLSVPFGMAFSSGQSSPDDPKLVVHLHYPIGAPKPLLSLVFDPDTVVGMFAVAVAELRDWAGTVK